MNPLDWPVGPLGIAFDPATVGQSYAIVSRDTFAAHFGAARHESALVRESTSPFDFDRDDDETTFRLALDGQSGYAVRHDGDLIHKGREGELVYVFSLERGRGDALVSSATGHDDATRLDCFDGYLVNLYKKHGFDVVRREPNWTPGSPDVVFMSR